MKENLQKLYNTLALIETKGENTKIMADCLRYSEQLIQQASADGQDEETKGKSTK